jgi:AcrR family transcriptional regulator
VLPVPSPAPVGRQAAREQMVQRIRTAAHVHLTHDGAAGLSMRAVARDVGVVSSAIYRYVPSRDALLELLVTDALESLSTAVTAAEAGVRRSDLRGRFAAVGRGFRSWALDSPAEHSLVAARPVPGFAPPIVDGAPLTAVPALLVAIVDEAATKGAAAAGDSAPRLAAGVRRDLTAIRKAAGVSADVDAVARALLAWAGLAGAVSLEVSGQLTGVFDDPEAWFGHELDRLARAAGIA